LKSILGNKRKNIAVKNPHLKITQILIQQMIASTEKIRVETSMILE